MSEGTIAIALALIALLTQVGAIVLILVRTQSGKAQVTITKNQADVDLLQVNVVREQLVNQMATQLLATQGTIIELVSDKAKAVEREKNYLVHIASLDAQLLKANTTLDKAYAEVTRLNAQVEQLVTSILADGKPEAATAAAKQVVAEKATPSTEPTTITQEAKDQVAAAPTPNGLPLGLAAKDKPAAVAENPPSSVPLPTPVVEAAQVPPGEIS